MYRRLIILSVIILTALGGLAWLGYHSIGIRAKGMEGARIGEFAATAEQIRQDVKRKLDEFMEREQSRPYTDYQYYYVAENVAPGLQQMPVLRSPLASRLDNGLAYGNFQIEPDGKIVTPYYRQEQLQSDQKDNFSYEARLHTDNIEQNLLPVLASGPELSSRGLVASGKRDAPSYDDLKLGVSEAGEKGKISEGRAGEFAIESLKQESQKTQVFVQSRSVVASNTAQSEMPTGPQQQIAADIAEQTRAEGTEQTYEPAQEQPPQQQTVDEISTTQPPGPERPSQQAENETVQIRIEPFVPVVIPGADTEQSIFGGQVFLLRHVQIEDKHLVQGFQLNEKRLIEEVKESAERALLTRERMSFELPQINGKGAEETKAENGEVAYTAILDFGFGDLVLNLIETDPSWISKRMEWLRNWYFGIITIVLLAVMLALGGLWHNARAQLKLTQKKDDFISAVSHELRTPLTSIRMYSEMLEKDWVKSDGKRGEYYKNMRQESERLSRLIENVLDFSRIQRGRKKYSFKAGDINKCASEVVEMMRPYATQNGFTIKTDFRQVGQATFDGDAVTQIIVNLLDNAIKYARNSKDKTITVRTRSDRRFVLIEVEDHGPGVPHLQRKKIFEEFYRSSSEATRETTGTGLGLALVKKFAQAHDGFVEIITAKPTGAIFRVALTARV